MRPSLFRFVAVVERPTFVTTMTAVALVVFGVYLEWVYPEGIDQALGITLFLQLFAASTGYRDRLQRGHFDPVLTQRRGRWDVAFAHWLASTIVGMAVWAMLGIIDLIGRPHHWPTPFTAAGMAVLLYVSTTVWMVTLPLVRFAGAILWLGALFALGATQHLQAFRQTFSAAPENWTQAWHSTASVLVFPVLLMIDPGTVSAPLPILVLVATSLAWVGGALIIDRLDGVLREN